jgi:hypothetical protein
VNRTESKLAALEQLHDQSVCRSCCHAFIMAGSEVGPAYGICLVSRLHITDKTVRLCTHQNEPIATGKTI